MKALYIASTGMSAQERNVEVISNNIANMRTTGFKRQRAEFQDLLYQQITRAGSQTSDQGSMVPAGLEIGSGVRTVATPRVMSQGNVSMTERELDVAIRGEGFFMIQLPDGRTAYTRDGSFERDPNGTLVNSQGYSLNPGISIPGNAKGVSISPNGTVEAFLGTDTTPTQLGQLQLARFVNKSGLESMGDNMFLETAASGPAQVNIPNSDGTGDLLQNYLEMANVNSVTEIADLIAAQRAYEMNARVISGADEMMRATSQLR
ncbi:MULTISPECIES: flagellar basal-body rod protein FlgG [Devosia]|uniref:Flagellar basal-body rod protein FlgG n=1 Tax=Devosia equisanguinis TaxID=2490941 RepID=A0A447IG34_9HYPH|nr:MULTISPECIES: flagellar basal-body rod protein FlgG [Devosia]ODT49996.1 MAG: flagellar basal-body rod protein FlgG [Pelagibacterium sp. SCN 63-126]ODU81303.1 MAG: flagellar basal-body rod protein FlgG [Pelagibacterium sp. SCN 63-17]OJX45321.1 MAG: flagellar basal-body rod protein FlgG [Devosia sp. 63-57]VDS06444.1 Flagellar basal-body rod protein FlgG [Devosia equisanguinis]